MTDNDQQASDSCRSDHQFEYPLEGRLAALEQTVADHERQIGERLDYLDRRLNDAAKHTQNLADDVGPRLDALEQQAQDLAEVQESASVDVTPAGNAPSSGLSVNDRKVISLAADELSNRRAGPEQMSVLGALADGLRAIVSAAPEPTPVPATPAPEPLAAIVLRPTVLAFAKLMETKLRKHDTTRGDRGWRAEDGEWAIGRINNELRELEDAFWNERGTEAIAGEAADVASVCMMLVDILDGLGVPDGPNVVQQTPAPAGNAISGAAEPLGQQPCVPDPALVIVGLQRCLDATDQRAELAEQQARDLTRALEKQNLKVAELEQRVKEPSSVRAKIVETKLPIPNWDDDGACGPVHSAAEESLELERWEPDHAALWNVRARRRPPDGAAEDYEDVEFFRCGYRDHWEHRQPFLTREAADEFITTNRHNLREPRVYVESAYRNPQWKLLRRLAPVLPELMRALVPEAEVPHD